MGEQKRNLLVDGLPVHATSDTRRRLFLPFGGAAMQVGPMAFTVLLVELCKLRLQRCAISFGRRHLLEVAPMLGPQLSMRWSPSMIAEVGRAVPAQQRLWQTGSCLDCDSFVIIKFI